MSFLNQVMLIGNLGKDPEVLKQTDSGCFVRIQIATNKKYTNAKGEKIEDTQWHSVNLNNGTGKFVSTYLKKGDKVLIIGELGTRTWTDKKGSEHVDTFVFARECKPLGTKKSTVAKTLQKSSDTSPIYDESIHQIRDILSEEWPQTEEQSKAA